MHVDHARALVLDSAFNGPLEILRLGHGDAICTAGSRPRSKVGIILLTGLPFVKRSTDFSAIEQTVLQIANRTPGEVVPHDPDDW